MRYSVQNIRNVCLLGHGGNGKTSLAESMLLQTGVIDRMGKVSDGNTVMDFDPEEKKRAASISTAVAPVEWKDCKLNIIDTPGIDDSGTSIRTTMGEQVLAIDAKNKVLLVRVEGSGYRGVLGVCADGAAEIADITFAHIRVGDIRDNALFNFSVQYDWSYTLEPGRSVRNITVSDLEYNGEGYELSTIQGYEAGRTVSGVHFENVRINGQHLTGEWEDMLEIGKFADNVTFS